LDLQTFKKMETLKIIGTVCLGFMWFYIFFQVRIVLALKNKKELTDLEKSLKICAMGNIELYQNFKYTVDVVQSKGYANKMDIAQFVTQGVPINQELIKICESDYISCMNEYGKISDDDFIEAIINTTAPGGGLEGLEKIFLK